MTWQRVRVTLLNIEVAILLGLTTFAIGQGVIGLIRSFYSFLP